MEVETTRFGRLSVAEEARVYFPEGLLGFGSYREYVLLPATTEGGPLYWLQSCQAPELAFAVCRAEAIVPGYQLRLPPEELAAVESTKPAEVTVFLIVHRDRGDLVANLRGPVIINQGKHLGKQVVINDTRLPLRYRVRRRKRSQPTLREATRKAV